MSGCERDYDRSCSELSASVLAKRLVRNGEIGSSGRGQQSLLPVYRVSICSRSFCLGVPYLGRGLCILGLGRRSTLKYDFRTDLCWSMRGIQSFPASLGKLHQLEGHRQPRTRLPAPLVALQLRSEISFAIYFSTLFRLQLSLGVRAGPSETCSPRSV